MWSFVAIRVKKKERRERMISMNYTAGVDLLHLKPRPLSMNHKEEFHQFNDTHLGEVNLSQHVVMVAVGHYVASVGLYGAVNELVIVRVGGDEVEAVSGSDELNIATLHESLNDSFGKYGVEVSFQDFLIFKQDFIGDTQGVVPIQNGQPDFTVNAVTSYALHKAVGVENYAHRLLSLLFQGFLLAQPCVKVHLVNLVEALLVKFARLPHFFSKVVEFLGVVVGNELLDVVEFLVALDGREAC